MSTIFEGDLLICKLNFECGRPGSEGHESYYGRAIRDPNNDKLLVEFIKWIKKDECSFEITRPLASIDKIINRSDY